MVVNVVFASGTRLREPPYSKAEEDEFYRRVDIIDDLDPDAEATGTVSKDTRL
jgi:hypothetical protein